MDKLWYEQTPGMFRVVESDEDHKKIASPWGNSFLTLTVNDLIALLAGKELYHFDGEYGTFIEFEDVPIGKELIEDLKKILDIISPSETITGE